MQSVLEQILELDKYLFLTLNNLGQPKWDSFWLWVTEKKSWIPFYTLLLGFSIWRLKKWNKIIAFIVLVAVLITIVDQSITLLFKPGFGRFRPCHDEYLIGLFREVVNNCGGYYSFFSAHSANSFALATLIVSVLKVNKIGAMFLFLWAFLVAYSRIYVGVHFPLDITIGAIWGILVARGLYFFWRKWVFFK